MGSYTTPSSSKLVFRQLFENESSTYTYLLADSFHPEKPALLIDPVDKTVERDLALVKELGLKLIYAINTHVHADHVTGSGLIKTKVPDVKSIISKASNAKADLFVEHGDKIYFGDIFLEVSTVGEEILYNPRLSKDKETFKNIMQNLNLSSPKMIDVAVPSNMVCGLQDSKSDL
ncbi:hypothetical protein RND71_037188 [Anisodus tanguticus]|uniref:Metallo-beta-lactamase domain-containing protein n=1 Tax=Anisodus tanguticus TaxID=243964 RepID=A0AAE1V0I1_9SOLA|nr:hypothetical protein RND71_037188 [Anisodus tanguticus]